MKCNTMLRGVGYWGLEGFDCGELCDFLSVM